MKIILAVLIAFSLSLSSSAGGPLPGKVITIDQQNFAKLTTAEQEHVRQIKERLEFIYNVDRSELTKAERQELRVELKELKKEVKLMNQRGPLIYVSATLLVVVIILILLLR